MEFKHEWDWTEEQKDLNEAVRKQDLITISELLFYFHDCWPKEIVAQMALEALQEWVRG